MSDVLNRAAPPPDLTLPYGPRAEHVVDLRLPARRPAPLIVLIRGGFWRPPFDRRHLEPGGRRGRNLMGGTPSEVPERYAAADPAALPRRRFPSPWCTAPLMTAYR